MRAQNDRLIEYFSVVFTGFKIYGRNLSFYLIFFIFGVFLVIFGANKIPFPNYFGAAKFRF